MVHSLFAALPHEIAVHRHGTCLAAHPSEGVAS